jgi:hypothetical protein
MLFVYRLIIQQNWFKIYVQRKGCGVTIWMIAKITNIFVVIPTNFVKLVIYINLQIINY